MVWLKSLQYKLARTLSHFCGETGGYTAFVPKRKSDEMFLPYKVFAESLLEFKKGICVNEKNENCMYNRTGNK